MASNCGVAGCQRNGITYNAAISAAEKAQAWWKYAITSTQNRIGCIIINSHHKHTIHCPEHLFWTPKWFYAGMAGCVGIAGGLAEVSHCKGHGSDDNGPGKEFFVSSHLVQDFEIPNHILRVGQFSATKPLKTVYLTLSSRFLYTWHILGVPIFHFPSKICSPIGTSCDKNCRKSKSYGGLMSSATMRWSVLVTLATTFARRIRLKKNCLWVEEQKKHYQTLSGYIDQVGFNRWVLSC